jgi:hypothetical protein
MLYVGHFSFTPLESADREVEEGRFTCLVEAESVEAAAEKFADLIISLDDSFDAFESVGNVYLDDITEVRKLPEEGVLVRYEEWSPDGLGTVSTSLPGVPPEYCVSYDWGPEGQDFEEDGREIEPFVVREE